MHSLNVIDNIASPSSAIQFNSTSIAFNSTALTTSTAGFCQIQQQGAVGSSPTVSERTNNKYPKNTVPQTVVSQTALFNTFEITAHWGTYSSDACAPAIVTLIASANIDGTTYTNNPVTFSYYPDAWGVDFPYSEVALDISSSFHTALLVHSWLLEVSYRIIRVGR